MDADAPTIVSEFDHELFEIELRIARRADQLTSILGAKIGHSFELWRTAEAEIWSQYLADRHLDANKVCGRS